MVSMDFKALNLYHTSACNACTVRYCLTNSVRLPMPVLCLNE